MPAIEHGLNLRPLEESLAYALRPSLFLLSPIMWRLAPEMMPALARRLRLEARLNLHAAYLIGWSWWATIRWHEMNASPLIMWVDPDA